MSGIEIQVYLALLLICLLLSAFFSGSETALISLQRFRLEHMVNTEVKGAERVARMIKQPEKLLSTILLGNNFINTAAAALGTAVAIELWREQGIIIATIAVTVLLLVFSETTPKMIATRHAERVSLLVARPIEVISWLLFPFVVVLSWIASGVTKLFGGEPVPRSLVSEEEIRTMISVGHKEGTFEEDEAEMLHKVFDFGNRPVREVIVPRTEVVWIEKGTKLADFLGIYAKSPLSRFPVYEDNMDNVVGILSVKDVLMALARDSINDDSAIDALIRPAYFAPESKRVSELFAEMRDKNYRMAVAVDEYGGTAGIVSLSRLVEEIVGPVGDELAEAEKEYKAINEYTFQVDGGMRIEEANQELELDLPEGEYETVAGFVFDLLGHIPKAGERIKYKDLKIVVTEMRGVKIEKVLLTKEKHAASAG